MTKFETILKLSEIKGILGLCPDTSANTHAYDLIECLIAELSLSLQEPHDEHDDCYCDACDIPDSCPHEWRPLYMIPGMFCPKCGERDV